MTGLATGSVYKYKLIASNSVGDGPESPQSVGILAAIAPTAPINLLRVASNDSLLTFSWSPPVDNGGIPVTDYQVMWDYGNSGTSYVTIATTTSGLLQYTKSSDLIRGETYNFKVMAVNAVGISVPSSALALIAAQEPLTPNAPIKVSASEN